jgi:hypothetical protein
VERVYGKQLTAAGHTKLVLQGAGPLCKRVERACAALGIAFNHGSVAKALRSDLAKMKNITELPQETRTMATKVFARIAKHFEAGQE